MILRSLAVQASKNPIEVVVSAFILVTLVYFKLLHAISKSNFFDSLDVSIRGYSSSSYNAVNHADGSLGAASQVAFGNTSYGRSTWVKTPEGWQTKTTRSEVDPSSEPVTLRPIILVDAEGQPEVGDDALLRAVASALKTAVGGIDAKGSTPTIEDASVHALAKTFEGPEGPAEEKDLLVKLSDNGFLEEVVNSALNANLKTGVPAHKWQLSPILSEQSLLQAGRPVPRIAHSQHPSEQLRSFRWMAYASRALILKFGALLQVSFQKREAELIFFWVVSFPFMHTLNSLTITFSSQRADSADIFVMLCAYIFMHATFVNLFLSMRKFGSNFWLGEYSFQDASRVKPNALTHLSTSPFTGASVLISSTFAFLLALTTAYSCRVTVDPVCLSEALPFLVVIVGFEKPYLLTRAVFTHPAFAPVQRSPALVKKNFLLDALNETEPASQDGDAPPNGSMSREESFVRALTARLKEESALRWELPQPLPAKDIILAAAEAEGPRIVRDYIIEILVLAVGATSGLSGLREFCQLAALILTFDCIFLFTFYCGILTVMVEVHRIKIMRGTRKATLPPTPPNVDSDEPIGSEGSTTPTSPTNSGTREGSPERSQRSLWKRACKLLFGYVPFEKNHGKDNPAARLKLMLMASFLILHSLNLVSTLTTQAAFSRHQSIRVLTPYESFLHFTGLTSWSPQSASIAPLIASLGRGRKSDWVLQISEPIILALVDAEGSPARGTLSSLALNMSASNKTLNAASIFVAPRDGSSSSFDMLDSLVTGWSNIVGDPVISKWMSIALAVSIFLNAYLLKGIATGNAAVAQGNAAGAAAFAAARMLGAHLNLDEVKEGRPDLPQKRFSDRTPKLAQKSDWNSEGINRYHKGLAKLSADKAATKIQSLPGPAEPADTALVADDVFRDSRRVNGKSDGAAAVNGDRAPEQDEKIHVNRRSANRSSGSTRSSLSSEVRPVDELIELYAGGAGVFFLSDEEIVLLAQKGKIAGHALEKLLQDHNRAVKIRRALISRASFSQSLEKSLLPHVDYNYAQVMGACCENVVGYMPIPVGIAGPLNIDGQLVPIPMATTEGTLVASTSRGCKALNIGGGVTTVLTQDAMTRGPALEFPSVVQAAKAKRWIDSQEGASTIKAVFDSTSRFARLSSLRCVLAGRTLFVRFATGTGDAMGMNMISKGVEKALAMMTEDHFPDMRVLSLSGNYCTDKKPAAINWIEGRGKSVVAEAVVPGSVVKTVLKTTVADLVNLNTKKNLIGSAMAGSIGGFNAHAANILTAIYLATGQDPAQNVESSNCITLMEPVNEGQDLLITISMPSIEVGTVGGGTVLSPQRAMLEMIGVAGAHPTTPGANAQRLARIIAASVMAGELSLLSALAAGHLIQA